MKARRGLILAVLWGRSAQERYAPSAPPVFWGRVGAYEGVTREGMLLLLAPDPVHPAKRVTTGA